MYNPVTGVEEVALVDTATEVSMGQKMAYQVAREFPISRDPALIRRVNEIGQKIARVSDRQDLIYYFNVIRSRQINAFTLPGGFIYVFSGLMEIVDDDEFAVVLAHEVGHVAARHPAKKMEINMGYDLLDSLIFGRSSEGDMRQVMNIFFNVMAAGYERGDELWADKLSILYINRAGYDPRAVVRFMRKLQEYESRRGSPAYTILSSHPPIEERIKTAEIELAKLEQGEASPVPKSSPSPSSGPSPESRPSSTSAPSPIPNSSSLPAPKPLPEARPRYGNIKICPTCRREYPLSFNYCTRDGSKLE